MEYEIWYGMGDIFLHIVTHDISYDTMNKLQISQLFAFASKGYLRVNICL